MLAVARGLGETAPILLTSLGNDFMNIDPSQPTDAIPLRVYNYAQSAYPAWQQLAWGGAIVLLVTVLVLSIVARILSDRQQTEAWMSGLLVDGLDAWYGADQIRRNVKVEIDDASVTAIIGPSGCGKSTLLRCLNRMHEEVPGARASGRLIFDDWDVYARETDPVDVRRHIGMVFQRPNPFPTMTVFENVVAGLKLQGRYDRAGLQERAEKAMRHAGVWDELKDRLGTPGARLSGGQQQRLCIARALAVEPRSCSWTNRPRHWTRSPRSRSRTPCRSSRRRSRS